MLLFSPPGNSLKAYFKGMVCPLLKALDEIKKGSKTFSGVVVCSVGVVTDLSESAVGCDVTALSGVFRVSAVTGLSDLSDHKITPPLVIINV